MFDNILDGGDDAEKLSDVVCPVACGFAEQLPSRGKVDSPKACQPFLRGMSPVGGDS
ncbi:hypothetical protein [Bacteroides ovatus]|uniref:hypothetical protein n=1 Tax=Bacteroides ovatus TaxID=28116 RepID=UPI0036F238ED